MSPAAGHTLTASGWSLARWSGPSLRGLRAWKLLLHILLLSWSGCNATGGRPRKAQPPAPLAHAVRWLGRVDLSHPAEPVFAWSGSGFEANFEGTGLSARLWNADEFVFLAIVDGGTPRRFAVQSGPHRYGLAAGLQAGRHNLKLMRQSEGQSGATRLLGLTVEGGRLLPAGAPQARSIEVIGDSISCGYGALGDRPSCPFSYATESHWDSYAALAARALHAEISTVAVSGAGLARNLDGTTVDTLPMLYDRAVTNDPRTVWLARSAPDAIVINLGTNDFIPGDPGLVFEDVYQEFLTRLRRSAPGALLVVAHGPMLFDEATRAGARPLSQLRRRLQAVLSARRREGDENVALLEFPTDQEGDHGCDYHPNARKHAAMADQLSALLRERLAW